MHTRLVAAAQGVARRCVRRRFRRHTHTYKHVYAHMRARTHVRTRARHTHRHATPRHATPRHATSRHATPRHATPCNARGVALQHGEGLDVVVAGFIHDPLRVDARAVVRGLCHPQRKGTASKQQQASQIQYHLCAHTRVCLAGQPSATAERSSRVHAMEKLCTRRHLSLIHI